MQMAVLGKGGPGVRDSDTTGQPLGGPKMFLVGYPYTHFPVVQYSF